MNPNDTTNTTVNPLTGDQNVGTQSVTEPVAPVVPLSEPVAPVVETPVAPVSEPTPMGTPVPEPVVGTENPGGMPPIQQP